MIPLSVPPPGPPPVAAAQPARPGPDQAPPVAQPDLGTAAVTATAAGGNLRTDPDRQAAVPIPAPLKPLGVLPLNTRKVGDLDEIADPPPPMGIDLPARLAELEPRARPAVDLRR